jgi:DNA polymerase-1
MPSRRDPSLQRLPLRTELGKKLQEALRPEPSRTLIEADYSEIELRILAKALTETGQSGSH